MHVMYATAAQVGDGNATVLLTLFTMCFYSSNYGNSRVGINCNYMCQCTRINQCAQMLCLVVDHVLFKHSHTSSHINFSCLNGCSAQPRV